MNVNYTNMILAEVREERKRQTEKYGVQRHTPERWLAIVMEEIGEMSQAMQKGTIAYKNTDADSMLTEAIQAAAVLTAFSEQLLQQIARFEPCFTCMETEHCAMYGRLCEGPEIGDGDGEKEI